MEKQKKELLKDKEFPKIDKTIFFGALILMLVVSGVCLMFPEKAVEVSEILRVFVIKEFDWFFLLVGIFVFILCIGIGSSSYGKIMLGEEGEKPAYSFGSWLSMIFFSAIGSSAILWSVCEPLNYIISPPFNYKPFSLEAFNIAVPYGLFHWGPVAWSFYALSGLVVAYYFLVLKRKNLKISGVISDLIGEKAALGMPGKAIDIFSIFATFCTFAPALGLGVPLLTELICSLTGWNNNQELQIVVLGVWMILFSLSVYRGLDKGIKILSNFNMVLLIFVMSFVFIVAGGGRILGATLEEFGTLLVFFPKMNTYIDTFNGGGFAQDWTVFYWTWWIAMVPFMAIFIARISKGRTIRQLIFGIVGAGSAGTMAIFCILGNYTLMLQQAGIDLAGIYQKSGSAAVILAMLSQLPFSKVIIAAMILLYFIFIATCVDSCAFTMGCISSKTMNPNTQPSRINRLTWACAIALLGVVILKLGGGLAAMQTFVVVVGLPAALLLIAMVILLFRWLRASKELKEKVVQQDDFVANSVDCQLIFTESSTQKLLDHKSQIG